MNAAQAINAARGNAAQAKNAAQALPWSAPRALRGISTLLLLASVAIGPISCRSTAPPDPAGGLTVSLDAVPLLLKADSVATSTIWATVLEKGHPVEDSTLVSFVTTLGTITAEAVTRDGLAKATFESDGQVGLAAIVAQVRAVRDTVLVTVY